MLRSFFLSKEWLLWAWGGALVIIFSLLIQIYITVQLNAWYGIFYDVLQKANDINLFWECIIRFLYLAIPYIFIAMFSLFFTQHYAFRWRQAISYYYFPFWSNSIKNIEGASQRIQQDTYEFAQMLETLGIGFLRSIMTLIAFIPILWNLSKHVTIPVLGTIEGSLVWVALITSIGGMIISYFVGIKLPKLEYNNQKVEAAYRKQLVYSEDNRSYANITSLIELFLGLRVNYFRIFAHYSYFTLWGTLYGQVMVILPYLIMAPSLFTSVITLGVVTQCSNSFNKVNDSFSYLIDNWTFITKFLSVIKRLREFEKVLVYKVQ